MSMWKKILKMRITRIETVFFPELRQYFSRIDTVFLQHFDNFQPVESRCRRQLINFGTLLFYPVIIVYMGINEICGGTGASMKYFKQLKCYDGLLESSFS